MVVLLADPDQAWLQQSKTFFENFGIQAKVCSTGKDCQMEVYRGGLDCVVLGLETKNYPGLTVMKYMALNHPKVKVILTIQSDERLKNLGINQEELKKLGAASVLVRPFSEEHLLKSIKGESPDNRKNNNLNEIPAEEENIFLASDEEFTRVKIESCQSGNNTIFDHYIRLTSGRFIKVIKRGDSFDTARMEKYDADKKIEFLYFKTKDRISYINFMNELLDKMMSQENASATDIIPSIKSVTDLYIEEIYTMGINPQMVEEGQKICQNMYKLLLKDKTLANFVTEFQDQDPQGNGHLFLVSFLSVVICRNLDWPTERTVDIVAMAGLLHDIGKLKLPLSLREMEETDVPEDLQTLYQQHPTLGMELLGRTRTITEQVKQIVYQHHERINGTGYPNGLTGTKIYSLAKIVSLADGFAHLLTTHQISPIEGLRLFIPNKHETDKYDAMAIKALVTGLMR